MDLNEGRVDVDGQFLNDIVQVVEQHMASVLAFRMEEYLIDSIRLDIQDAPTKGELERGEIEDYEKAVELGSKGDLQRALDNWNEIKDYLSEKTNLDLGSEFGIADAIQTEVMSVSLSDWPEAYQDLVVENDPLGNWSKILVFTDMSEGDHDLRGQFHSPDDNRESPHISFWPEAIANRSAVRFEYDAWFDIDRIESRRHTPIPVAETLDFFQENWESLLRSVRSTARHEIVHWIDYSTPDYVMKVADPHRMEKEDIEDLAGYEEHSARASEFWTDLSSFLDRVENDVQSYGRIPRPMWKVWLGVREPLPDSWFKKYERQRGNRTLVSRSENGIWTYFSALQKVSQDRYRKAVKIVTAVAENNGWLKGGGSFGDLSESVFRELMLYDRPPKDVILESIKG